MQRKLVILAFLIGVVPASSPASEGRPEPSMMQRGRARQVFLVKVSYWLPI
jgi:hypothetical protein